MFGSVTTAVLLAASASSVVAGPLNGLHRHIARNYRQDAAILEDYTPYHVRYIALDCQDKHNTTFFEDCCHPLLRTQKLSDRPSKCIPSASASSSAALVEPTAPVVDNDPLPECDPEQDPDDEDCDDEPTTSVAVSSAAPTTVKPTSTKSHSEPAVTSSSEAPVVTSRMITSHTAATHTSTSKAEPTSSAAPDNSGGKVVTGGHSTFYTQDGTTGACGIKHGDYDKIVAMDYRMYGDINSVSKWCGKTVRITNLDDGKTLDAVVADACPSCDSEGCLDMSLGLWDAFGVPRSAGVFPIKYTILDA